MCVIISLDWYFLADDKFNKAADRAALPDPSLAERGNVYDFLRSFDAYPYLVYVDCVNFESEKISKTALSLAG